MKYYCCRIGQVLGSISLVKDLNQSMHSRSITLRVASGKNISYWKKPNNFYQLPACKCEITTTVMKTC